MANFIRAGSDTELLAMDWNDLKKLLDVSDPTARDLMKIVEQRRAQIPD
jgi:CRP-like cAMP-binding protein